MLDFAGLLSISWPAVASNYHQMAADTVYLKPQSQNPETAQSELDKVRTNNEWSERIMLI